MPGGPGGDDAPALRGDHQRGVHGDRLPAPNQALYGITKAGVTFLSKVLAAEAGPHGIRVNVVAPGATPTNFGRLPL